MDFYITLKEKREREWDYHEELVNEANNSSNDKCSAPEEREENDIQTF